MSRKPKEPVFDDDNPEWTAEDFAIATRFEPGIKASDLTPEILANVARRGPQKAPTKVPVSLRLSSDVVKHFKDTGPGWQSRIDEALRKIAKV
ncbi:MAG: BrnA antitoxin family protein [Hyphomicrobiales bacterium]|jgi:uncharacterized protein (DUF4415 family)|nr:BrnA antitoxin family protein [Hyphomicrobiales bacterium]